MGQFNTIEEYSQYKKNELEKYNVEDATILMRYMSLPKFLSLLQNQSLFLTRADNFEGEAPVEDFTLEGYDKHPHIKGAVSV